MQKPRETHRHVTGAHAQVYTEGTKSNKILVLNKYKCR